MITAFSQQQYDVILSRPSKDLSQWRIKIEVNNGSKHNIDGNIDH